MNIKDKFYGKLQQIREDYDSEAAEHMRGSKYGEKGSKKASREDVPWNKKWHDDNAKAFAKSAKKYAKRAVTGMDEGTEQLDELKMDKKTYVSAMQRTTGYDADYSGEEGRIDTDKLIARAKKYKGNKFAKDLAGADNMTERPNRNKVSGQWGSDQLAWRKASRKTKDGKANKTDTKALKASLKKGDYRKPDFPKRNLPESEQLDELHGKSKEAMKLIKKRLEKKHNEKWDETYEKRKREKLKGSEKTREIDAARNNIAKRWLRADKAETKLKEENLDDVKKTDKQDKLFLRSRKMIAISKLDRNRERNKNNKQD